MYANGFLLLTVVLMPFPTSLMGEFLLKDHGAPAVVLYDAMLAIQALGWILVSGTAVRSQLTCGEGAAATMGKNGKHGSCAFVLYGLFSITAFWFPLPMAIVTTLSWIFWLMLGVRMKPA